MKQWFIRSIKFDCMRTLKMKGECRKNIKNHSIWLVLNTIRIGRLFPLMTLSGAFMAMFAFAAWCGKFRDVYCDLFEQGVVCRVYNA